MPDPSDDAVAQDTTQGLLKLAFLQEFYQRHGLWPAGGLELNQEEGTLSFVAVHGREVVERIQIIGSIDSSDGTWLWAWANPSVHEPLRQAALQVKAFGEKHGSTELTTACFPCSEEKGWELVAIALHVTEGANGHKLPNDGGWIFATAVSQPDAPSMQDT